jgi:hypothetical protein
VLSDFIVGRSVLPRRAEKRAPMRRHLPAFQAQPGAVHRAVHQAFVDEGLGPQRAKVSWDASAGFERGGTIRIRVEYPVTAVQFPFLGKVSGPSILIKAIHFARIDPYRSRS